ncbi:MAG: carboxylesterase family protein [Alphaproteobacteria bacterium]|nr:carboxylesterase family protein [Alphaproteobacteria bacterium]MBU1514153.1 carboxylesterase family protein [Alphaproteobacteria bacterium]MBU2096198.1 carboxylesterase family protein [Alphaproteobacteria bacterium]MBU2151152.1 carboxylesterase family protein [Alphaproteobacteria bacterium]MBU2307189.1 carboxylesterase family protein [Alphaproteobacteria bacterium]
MRLALIVATAWLAAGLAQAQTPVKAKVEGGVLVGEATDKANIFRDIPFAAAPVGKLRWAPPQPAAKWTGARDATKNGPSCPQPMNANDTPNSGGANGPISEDCLQLNVFAPKGAKAAPVMVWIHGGSHRTGAGWVYDGSNFARDGVVLVSINYRLGALGYFAHPALTKDAGANPTGNFGLMDQIAALEWVKRNVAAFGGDPKNVTVFGESAGGMSTLALLATPKAEGLYQKAAVQSGGGWFPPVTLAAKEQEGAAALAKAGVAATATADELRALPVATLVPIAANYGPFIDGKLMTQTASQALAHGTFADVPLIVGSNSGEDSLMAPGPLTPAQIAMVPAIIRPIYKDEAAQGDEVLARAVFTDRIMGGAARWVADEASGGQPAWLYHFSYVGSRFRPALKTAAHAAEIQYVFDYWGRRTPMSMVAEDDKAMAALMHACWVSFAKTGAPKCGAEAWPAYDAKSDKLMEFGTISGVRTNFRKPQLDLQQSVAVPTLGLTK